jgi:hypothetical protein
MKGGNSGTNGSDLDNNNIIKPTFDTLMVESRKAFEPYRTDLEELFLSCYEMICSGEPSSRIPRRSSSTRLR